MTAVPASCQWWEAGRTWDTSSGTKGLTRSRLEDVA